MLQHVVLAVAVVASASAKAINSFAGPYIVYTNQFWMCDGEYPWPWHMRTSHFNPAKPAELQMLTGHINATQLEFDDSMWMTILMDTRSNNQWKENAFVFKFPKQACSNVRSNMPDFYRKVFKKTNFKEACLVKPGFYPVNEPIAWVFPNVPVMPYGRYRFRLSAGSSQQILACYVVDCQVIPKLS